MAAALFKKPWGGPGPRDFNRRLAFTKKRAFQTFHASPIFKYNQLPSLSKKNIVIKRRVPKKAEDLAGDYFPRPRKFPWSVVSPVFRAPSFFLNQNSRGPGFPQAAFKGSEWTDFIRQEAPPTMTDKIKITKFNVNNETFVKIDVPKSILPKNRLDREEFLKKIAKQVTQKFLDDTVEPTAADKKTEKTKKVDDKPSKARKKTEKPKTIDKKNRPE
ncbi:MAG: hypothetical protein LBR53_10315 [Deltaproteobacteria bacterium]|nr:hypothetical protein [Deltaproteobacteria bacterium]